MLTQGLPLVLKLNQKVILRRIYLQNVKITDDLRKVNLPIINFVFGVYPSSAHQNYRKKTTFLAGMLRLNPHKIRDH